MATEIMKQQQQRSQVSSPNDLSGTSHSKGSSGSHISNDSNQPDQKRIIYKRADGSTGVSSRDVFDRVQKVSDTRKVSITESLGKFGLDGSFRDDKPVLLTKQKDVYACDELGAASDISYDSGVFSVGEEPAERETFLESASLNAVLHKNNSNHHINTSASDDQWHRFKLLGREGFGKIELSDQVQSLVDKNVDKMTTCLKQIIALRKDDVKKETSDTVDILTGNLMNEVKHTLDVPVDKMEYKRDPGSIRLDAAVSAQLRDYVTVISCMYRDNAFHNFEHASQVVQSSSDLLSYIEASDEKNTQELGLGDGIAVIRDPWTHFALIFSALIHDVDHAGVPNEQLIKERSVIAGAYKDKSVAEQNSIELAWNLLMEPVYRQLRDAIFVTKKEISRFRKLVVTFVLATDIANKELAKLRRDRAKEAIDREENGASNHNTAMHVDIASRKATYIMETIMQAADVSHTMQSFPIYLKWNEKLYREMYSAFALGRAIKDPTDSWFDGDIGFFDFYIIPLAQKLVACGVLNNDKAQGLLNNAISNRKKWQLYGNNIVASYTEQIKDSRRSLVSLDKTVESALSDLSDDGLEQERFEDGVEKGERETKPRNNTKNRRRKG